MVTLHHMCDKNYVASMDCAVFLLHVYVIDTKQLSSYCDAVNSVKLPIQREQKTPLEMG